MLALPLRGSTPELYHGKYVAGMFGAGEQGVWYDPSDKSTLFQDAAGTIPVTAVEQPVGLMKDKSGRGNHATQTTSTSRPVLSARYNLLTNTERFDQGNWYWWGLTCTPNFAASPLGSMTADFITEKTDTNVQHIGYYGPKFSVISGMSYRFSVYLKKHTTSRGLFRAGFGGSLFSWAEGCAVNLNTETVFTPPHGSNAKLTNVGDGWYRVEYTALAPSTGTAEVIIGTIISGGSSTYTGDGVSGGYVWGISVVPVNQAHLPYQRVNTATDYDADPVKFPPYLKFDGVDDGMVTASIDFTATDKMTVMAGVMAITPSFLIICELSNVVNSNNGSFYISCYSSGSYAAGSKGTILEDAVSAKIYPYPTTNTITLVGDISGDRSILRVNGSQVSKNTGDQGTGNYGNYPLYIGLRGGTTFPFAGNLYGLIVRGAQTDDAHLTHAEKFLAYKSGVTL